MAIAPDVKLWVVELRKEGYTYTAITEMTGVSAYNICREAGLVGMGHGRRGRKSKHSKEEKQKAIDLRNEGYTYAAITEITGIAVHNVTNYCIRAGAKSGHGHLGKNKRTSPFAARNKTIRELRERGLTLEQIGEIYNITRERVRQLCVGIKSPDLRARVNCHVCGTEFVHAERNSKYCSGECRKKSLVELFRQKNAKFSKHAVVELTCTGCGVKFKRANRLEGIAECGRVSKGKKDSGRRFCSKECYQKNWHTKDNN
jgi:uncharacterized protein YerC